MNPELRAVLWRVLCELIEWLVILAAAFVIALGFVS